MDMDCQMYRHNGKGSLCSVKSIIGCEERNPSNDSTLIAMFEDLQEGTLLSAVNNDVLDTDLRANWIAPDIGMVGQSITGKFSLDNLFESVPFVDNSSGKVHINEESPTFSVSESGTVMDDENEPSQVGPTENSCSSSTTYQASIISGNSCKSKGDALSPTVDLQQQLDCIHHDHCYIKESGYKQGSFRSAYSSSSDSLEESTNSDGGYETMSVTTSPGILSSAEHPSGGSLKLDPPAEQITSPLCPFIEGHIDPVTLIDSRIRHLMSSCEVGLTEEEKLTLKAEGLPIPTTLPLTKTEEKALRNVRRKIRNKVAAQQSRKRKKEHLLTLEQRVKAYSTENVSLRKRIEMLESENKVLFARLQKVNSSGITHLSTQAGACLMIIALCFAIILGGCAPTTPWSSQKQSDYTTSSVRSRSLLSLEYQTNFQSFTCSWFHHMIVLHSGLDCFCTDMCGDSEGSEVVPSSIKELTNVSDYNYNTNTVLYYSSLHTSDST